MPRRSDRAPSHAISFRPSPPLHHLLILQIHYLVLPKALFYPNTIIAPHHSSNQAREGRKQTKRSSSKTFLNDPRTLGAPTHRKATQAHQNKRSSDTCWPDRTKLEQKVTKKPKEHHHPTAILQRIRFRSSSSGISAHFVLKTPRYADSTETLGQVIA